MLEQTVKLSYNGSEQVLNIPNHFSLPSSEVIIRKEGNRLIIEPAKRPSLLAFLSTLSDIEEDFPDVDAGFPPLSCSSGNTSESENPWVKFSGVFEGDADFEEISQEIQAEREGKL